MTDLRVIVIAWVETVQVAAAGQTRRSDLGGRPRMVEVREARAAMWSLSGSDTDFTSAHRYCASSLAHDGSCVYVYSADEPDPLGRARSDALRSA